MSASKIKFSGAGVLLVCNKKTLGPCIILVNDYTQKWSDLGGSYEDKHGTPDVTAATETYEESRGVIQIAASSLTKYVDLPVQLGIYRSYIAELADKKWCTVYNQTDTSKMSHAFQETNGMRYFPLAQVLSNISSTTWLSDSGGNLVPVPIHPRVQRVVSTMHKQGFFNKYLQSSSTTGGSAASKVTATTPSPAYGLAIAPRAVAAASATMPTTASALAAAASSAAVSVPLGAHGAGLPVTAAKKCGLPSCTKSCNGSFSFCSRSCGRIAQGCLVCKKPCTIICDAKGDLYVHAFCSQSCGRTHGKVIHPIKM